MRSSRRSSTAWGAALGYASIALGIGRNIVLVPLYLQFLSPTEYGAWLATGGTLVQLLASDFGVGGVILQRTAAASGAGDNDRLSVLLGTAWTSSIVIALIVSAITAALTPFIPRLLGLDAAIAGVVVNCFLLSIVANAISIVGIISGNLLRGLQLATSAGIIQLIAEILVIAVTVLLLCHGYGLYSLAWGMLARALFAAVGCACVAYHVCVRQMGLLPRLRAQESRRLVVDSSRLFVVSLSMKMLTRSDVFFVAALLGSSSAAVYGLTIRIIDTVSMLISQLTTALLPGMAHLYGEGDITRFRDILNRVTPVLSALALAGLATAAFLDRDFVSLWVGRGLYGGSTLAFLFAAAAFVSVVGFIAYDVLMAAGRFQFIARTFTIFAMVQVPATILLLQWVGIAGAPIAIALSSLGWCISLWTQVPRVISPQSLDFGTLRRALGASMIVVTIIIGLGMWSAPAALSWTMLGAMAIATAIIILAGILIVSRDIRIAAKHEAWATLNALGWKS
jgi:O-antigen/teichoic acid export membrane protein